jgi:O-antigen ligase
LLCLGPRPLPYCKVTAFNAWAFALAAHLPDLGLPATNPNAIAGALAVALAFVSASALYARTRQHRLLAASAATLLTLCLVLTASRTAWLAAAAGVALVAANRGRRQVLLVLAVAGALILVLLAVDPALRSPANLAARGALWRSTLVLVCAQPFTGLGFGRAAYFSPLAATAVHNALLQLWTDTGFLGLVGLGWLAVRAVRGRTALARRRLQPGWTLAGLDGALIAFAVQGLFESNILFAFKTTSVHQVISPLPFALLGLLVGLDRYARHLAQMRARIPPRRVTMARRSAPAGVWRATVSPLARPGHVDGTTGRRYRWLLPK